MGCAICLCEDPDNPRYNIQPLTQDQINVMLYEDNSSLGAVVIKKKKKKQNNGIHEITNNMHHRGNSTNNDEVAFLNKIIDENPEQNEDQLDGHQGNVNKLKVIAAEKEEDSEGEI